MKKPTEENTGTPKTKASATAVFELCDRMVATGVTPTYDLLAEHFGASNKTIAPHFRAWKEVRESSGICQSLFWQHSPIPSTPCGVPWHILRRASLCAKHMISSADWLRLKRSSAPMLKSLPIWSKSWHRRKSSAKSKPTMLCRRLMSCIWLSRSWRSAKIIGKLCAHRSCACQGAKSASLQGTGSRDVDGPY